MNIDSLLKQGGGIHPSPDPALGDGVFEEGLVETWSSIVLLWH